MMRINIALAIVAVIGTCLAAETVKTDKSSTQKSPQPVATEEKKEKRDAPLSSGPYSYEPPQKSYQLHLPSSADYKPSKVQQSVNYHQKPAPVEIVHIPKKEVHTYEHAKQQPSAPHGDHYSHLQFSYPSSGHAEQQHYLQALPLKNYPSEVSYQSHHEPATSSYYYRFPSSSSSSYKSPPSSAGYNYAFSSYQPLHTASPPPQAHYTFEQPSYHHHHQSKPQLQQPQQQHQQPQQYYYGYQDINSLPQLFYPYVEEQNLQQQLFKPAQPQKVPEYATGHKGLGHYASYQFVSPIQSTYEQYVKPQQQLHQQQVHEQPIYTTQTERPFNKPSIHLTTPLRESYNVQLINSKPSTEYLPAKQTYLPPREEIIVQPPSKTYLPAKESVIEFVQQPAKSYLPAREEYLAPSKTYYRPKEPQKQVEYQVQYITVPEKSYLPASQISNSYIPPKKIQEAPKNTYIPPVQSTTARPSYSTAPPKHTYLPPNNPYQQQQSNHPAKITHYSQSQYDNQNNDQFENSDYHQQYKRSSSSSSTN